MKCPHCDQKLKADMSAFYNVETYGETVWARTMCCERLVTIKRVCSQDRLVLHYKPKQEATQ